MIVSIKDNSSDGGIGGIGIDSRLVVIVVWW